MVLSIVIYFLFHSLHYRPGWSPLFMHMTWKKYLIALSITDRRQCVQWNLACLTLYVDILIYGSYFFGPSATVFKTRSSETTIIFWWDHSSLLTAQLAHLTPFKLVTYLRFTSLHFIYKFEVTEMKAINGHK